MKSPKVNMALIRIDRIAAWILLASIALYFVSGYGMLSKGFLSVGTSTLLHERILPFVAIPAFLVHTFFGVRAAFKRWRIWNRLSGSLLLLIYLAGLVFLAYLHFFSQPKYYVPASNALNQDSSALNETEAVKSSSSVSPIDSPQVQQNSVQTETAKSSEPAVSTSTVFTAKTLAKYNGLNGNPSYVAIDGVVYDFSLVFKNGKHSGYSAGQDLSSAFHNQHSQSLLKRFPIVGKYE